MTRPSDQTPGQWAADTSIDGSIGVSRRSDCLRVTLHDRTIGPTTSFLKEIKHKELRGSTLGLQNSLEDWRFRDISALDSYPRPPKPIPITLCVPAAIQPRSDGRTLDRPCLYHVGLKDATNHCAKNQVLTRLEARREAV